MPLLNSLCKTLGYVCVGGWGKQCKVRERNEEEEEIKKTFKILIVDPSQTFSAKLKGQWKLWELSFFFLSCFLFLFPPFFLYFIPSPFSLQSDKVSVLHFKQKRAQNFGGQSKLKKKKQQF